MLANRLAVWVKDVYPEEHALGEVKKEPARSVTCKAGPMDRPSKAKKALITGFWAAPSLPS